MSAAAATVLLSERYRLHEKLGEGRLAAVYRATDESLQRGVLVHVLRKDLVEQEQLRQRFVAEINASARRTHPALLDVFDSGEVQGRPFMVTEYVDGRPLREQGALPLEHALLYMRQVAGAVALCQAQDIPHPPVSSSNVLLVQEGHVKLVESWLMSPADVPFDLAHYRAPERTEGMPPQSSNVVYALGLLLYELITGTRPAHGRTPKEVAQSHLALHVPALSRSRPLSHMPTLDSVIRRATVRTLAQRLPDGTSFANALDEAWRKLNADTQRLFAAAAPTPPARAPTNLLPRPFQRTTAPPLTPDSALEPPQKKGFVSPASGLQTSFGRFLLGWTVVIGLLFAVAYGSYVGASYVAAQFWNVRLPQISLPDIGFPQVNLPNIDLEVPDWLMDPAPNEIFIVNIQEGLNMRDQPGLNTNVIAVVPNGTRVRKLEGPTVVDDVPWVRVRVEDDAETREGWMSLNFLSLEA